MEKCIVVPIDFTEVSQAALEHAFKIHKVLELPISLIHVVKSSSQIEEAENKLNALAQDFAKDKDIEIDTDVKKGNLFKTIYSVAQEKNAYLAVMGTHGQKTVKKAMKVVSKFVKIAFILVQEPPKNMEINKIVVPIDDNKKGRANFNWIRFIATVFNSKVVLVYTNYKQAYKNKLLVTNLRFAERILTNNYVDYVTERIKEGSNFSDEIYNQIRAHDADMLSVMSTSYKEYITKLKQPENLELYKETPILCVNPRVDLEKLGGLA